MGSGGAGDLEFRDGMEDWYVHCHVCGMTWTGGNRFRAERAPSSGLQKDIDDLDFLTSAMGSVRAGNPPAEMRASTGRNGDGGSGELVQPYILRARLTREKLAYPGL